MTTTVQASAAAQRPASAGTPASTGSRFTRLLGLIAVAMLVLQLALALLISPAEQTQGDAVRLFYVHVPLAIAGRRCCRCFSFPSSHPS